MTVRKGNRSGCGAAAWLQGGKKAWVGPTEDPGCAGGRWGAAPATACHVGLRHDLTYLVGNWKYELGLVLYVGKIPGQGGSAICTAPGEEPKPFLHEEGQQCDCGF